jgi:hypothetical protein
MPVNSFDDYPLTWKPERTLLKSPIYLSLAALLERDIISGRLAPNTKLPNSRIEKLKKPTIAGKFSYYGLIA